MNKIPAVLASVLLAFAGPDAIAQGAPAGAASGAEGAYRSDWPKIARLMLHRSLQLQPGERVIIQYQPGRNPGLVEALRTQIATSGAIVAAELTWPGEAVARYYGTLSADQKEKLAEQQNAVYSEIFARSDVYIWLDEGPAEDLTWRQFERLIAGSKVRAVHCHYFDSPDPREHDLLWRMYEEAIEVEPAQLDALLTSMADELRAATVHLTSPEGTDLTFKVSNDAWFHKNSGDASPGKARNPASTRDREEEIPASVLRSTGVVETNGKLVATVFSSQKKDTVVLTFSKGRIIKVEPTPGGQGEEFARWFARTTGDRDRVSELVLGTNPRLSGVLPSGFMPDFGYGAGIVRLDVGENWESGGSLRTSDHQQWWMIVTDGTLKAGRKTIVKDGKLVASAQGGPKR